MRLFQTRRPLVTALPPVSRRMAGDYLRSPKTGETPTLTRRFDSDIELPDPADALLAASETEGRIARTTARLLLLADELEARHVRYAWTERLAEDLRAIAHDTVGG